jgi:hypothetical protein
MIGREQKQSRESCRKSLLRALKKSHSSFSKEEDVKEESFSIRGSESFPIMHRCESHVEFSETERFILDNRVQEDKLVILEGAHFMCLANAIYGKLLTSPSSVYFFR